MLWEVEIHPESNEVDREAARVLGECRTLGADSVTDIQSAHSFLIQGSSEQAEIERAGRSLLSDTVVETFQIHRLNGETADALPENVPENTADRLLLNVLYKPGVTDNVAQSTQAALTDLGLIVDAVSTCRKYWINENADEQDIRRLITKILSNDAIEQVIRGPLAIESISLGSDYEFQLTTVPILAMNDEQLTQLSREGQLYLSLTEMQTIQQHFVGLKRDATDIELETIAQTWSEHCSHKTLAGRIHYRDDQRDLHFENMLKETIFAATQEIRQKLGDDDWCVSVFKDNAGIVTFDEKQNVCFKVETHNHPSALEPYGGANTGIGGVIRDPLGTGLGAKPICNTDVFCFAPPDLPSDELPPGVLHPKAVMQGVVSGVRDYGNRMGIPTVNGTICFDERYLGNPLVYCGNVAMIPVDKCDKEPNPGDLIVTVGGRTGRDGIHGATFSSSELTHESETISGGSVQIGNAITEKMVADVILEARDKGLYTAITDCGAGGFSSAVGEMGEEIGAEVWLEKAPLKYSGLSYTEIWISEAQERMVLSVPPKNWDEFKSLCNAEGVETEVIGEFTATKRLVLKYEGHEVGNLAMSLLHDGRPPVIREAVYDPQPTTPLSQKSANRPASDNQSADAGGSPEGTDYNGDLKQILGSLNVCSKEWVIRQYDHEVQAGSVIKPLVGIQEDGPSDAAVVRPDLTTNRGLVVSCGLNPRYGDLDPYWMAASAIDEAVRNCIAVGADPNRIAILDNFCWGNTERPGTLGTLVRAALACYDVAIAFQTPFISGKDSLNNEFSYVDAKGNKQTVGIPSSLLISALGQIDDVRKAVTMDLKESGNFIYLVGVTKDELGGSHFALVNNLEGGQVPQVDIELAPKLFAAIHQTIADQLVRSCHDLSEGGLAVAAAEMAFAGGLGVELDLKSLAKTSGIDDDMALLFSESNTRFLLEVPAAQADAFEKQLDSLPCVRLGQVVDSDSVTIQGAAAATVINASLAELKDSWQAPLAWD